MSARRRTADGGGKRERATASGRVRRGREGGKRGSARDDTEREMEPDVIFGREDVFRAVV